MIVAVVILILSVTVGFFIGNAIRPKAETTTQIEAKIDDKVKTTDAATAGLGCHGGFES